MKELVDEIVRREAGNEFLLYWGGQGESMQADGVGIIEMGTSRRNVLDVHMEHLVIVLLVVCERGTRGIRGVVIKDDFVSD